VEVREDGEGAVALLAEGGVGCVEHNTVIAAACRLIGEGRLRRTPWRKEGRGSARE